MPSLPIELRAVARAKVNLSLEVLRKRRDGYHEIETILQSVDLADLLEITVDRSGRIEITCTDPDIPVGGENLCYRAVEAMRELAGGDLGARIHISKHIPHSAGLGGGSADAAAVILAVERALGLNTDPQVLEAAAARLGSDVPFMLYGGTMLAHGRGEVVTPLQPLGGGFFLIVKPPVDISTREVYERVNLTLTRHRYRINLKRVNALLARFPNVSLSFRNVLEDVVCPSNPQVAEVLAELMESSPRFAAMSGSGSALFAIFSNQARASDLAGKFSLRGMFTAVAVPAKRAIDLSLMNAR